MSDGRSSFTFNGYVVLVRIPARHIQKRWARNRRRKRCAACGERRRKDLVLHHDHLVDFALVKLRCRLRSCYPDHQQAERKLAAVWPSLVETLRRYLYVDPCWVCRRCNSMDARGKDPGYRNLGRLYDDAFSMRPDDLGRLSAESVRNWLPVAKIIWEREELAHRCRLIIVALRVRAFVRNGCVA
jgi:hypothetical protein